MSHDGSLMIGGARTAAAGEDSARLRLAPTGERDRLRAELLRRIVVREEERQYLRRMPR